MGTSNKPKRKVNVSDAARKHASKVRKGRGERRASVTLQGRTVRDQPIGGDAAQGIAILHDTRARIAANGSDASAVNGLLLSLDRLSQDAAALLICGDLETLRSAQVAALRESALRTKARMQRFAARMERDQMFDSKIRGMYRYAVSRSIVDNGEGSLPTFNVACFARAVSAAADKVDRQLSVAVAHFNGEIRASRKDLDVFGK